MGDLVFSVQRVVRATPQAVFRRIAADQAAGWLFGFACDRLAPGTAVRFEIPTPSGEPVAACGRLIRVEPDRCLVIQQEGPWQGRITLTLDPVADGTQAKLVVSLAEDCIPWFLSGTAPSAAYGIEPSTAGRAGFGITSGAVSGVMSGVTSGTGLGTHSGADSGVQPGTDSSTDFGTEFDAAPCVRLGIMVSLSGPAGVFGRSAVNAATLAAEQINAAGGIRGLPLRLSIGDDRTRSDRAAAEFTRLVDEAGSDAVVAMVPSASFAAMVPLARARGTLLMHSPLTEAGPAVGTVFELGERPADQLAHSIPALMAATSARGWFVIGNDYCWPRSVGRSAQRIIASAGGSVLGERYVPLGHQEFGPVIEAIERSRADLIVSALVGRDAVTFERAFYAAGGRSRARTIAALMDETVREHIGDAAASGIWSVLDYLGPSDGRYARVAQAWAARFGPWSPPLSSTALSVYDAVHLYAKAAHVARSTSGLAVAGVLHGRRLGNIRPLARAAGFRRPTRIAQAVPGGFAALHVG